MKKLSIIRVYILAILAIATFSSQAEIRPQRLITDSRIKIVKYSPNQVVKVYARFGYAITVELEKGEYLVNDAGFGKEAGWYLHSTKFDNKIIIKPLVKNSETNFNFATNRGREYTLILVPTSNLHHQTFRVRFNYPRLNFAQIFASHPHTSNLISGFGNPKQVNDQYSFYGNKAIAPISVKDNGRFTLIKFKPHTPIPAILAVDLKTYKESIINFRVQDGYVVVEGVNAQYTLRYGEQVTCLFNDRVLRV